MLRKTAVNTENLKLFDKTDTTVSVVEKDGHQVYKLVVSGSSNAGAYFNGNNAYYNLVKDRNYTFSFWVLTNKDKNYNINSLGHIQTVNTNSDKVGNDFMHQHTWPVYSTNVIKANTWTKVWCTFKATSNSYFKPYFWYLAAGDEIYIYDMMLNENSAPAPYSQAPEDLGWSTATLVPTQSQRYLWKFEYVYYSDGSVEVTSPINISIAGADGAQGPKGDTGAKGEKGDKGDTGATGPQGPKGDKGATGDRGPQGIQGIQGPKGDQGIQGPKGADGKTQYTHIAYADNATGGGFSQTDQTKAYIGMYVDFNATDSTDPTKYRWSKWHGDKGATGAQGIQGPKGADGRTPYLHIAYANSADGKTGFTTTNSNNKRYIGTLTDYTQADSTDPTKYKWVDMVGSVEVGSKNLLRKTSVTSEHLKLFGTTDTTVSVVEKDGHQVYKLVVSGSSNAGTYFVGNSDYYNLVKDRTYTFSFWVFTNKDKDFNINSLGHIQLVNNNSDKAPGYDAVHQHTSPVYSTNKILKETWTKVWCTFKATSNSYFKPYFWYLKAGDEIYIYDMMLNEGTLPLSHSLAPEDMQEEIDSKADQALTQQQLNALAEQNSIVKAEMEAKASIDTVNQWITAYQNYVNANDEAKAESERNLQEASARILQLKTDVGTLRQQWDFIDTYMTVQNEGLIIGKSDGSAYAKFANDRISLFSGSSEVMYISQGVLRIENGIFTKTIQIGRFRFETHPADQDMLVLRYLGG